MWEWVYKKQKWQLVKPGYGYRKVHHTILILHMFGIFHNEKEGKWAGSHRNLGLNLTLIYSSCKITLMTSIPTSVNETKDNDHVSGLVRIRALVLW